MPGSEGTHGANEEIPIVDDPRGRTHEPIWLHIAFAVLREQGSHREDPESLGDFRSADPSDRVPVGAVLPIENRHAPRGDGGLLFEEEPFSKK